MRMRTMNPRAGRKKSDDRPKTPPAAPQGLSPFARKLDRAFRQIAAGQYSVREVEIVAPMAFGPDEVRATRERLAVSVAVFARLLGVSAKLVEHWEQGRRIPSPLARRLLERVNTDPATFLSDLMVVRNRAG